MGGPAVLPPADVGRVLMLCRIELGDGPTSATEIEVTRVTETGQQRRDLGDGVGVMAFLGFHHNRRPIAGERLRGAP